MYKRMQSLKEDKARMQQSMEHDRGHGSRKDERMAMGGQKNNRKIGCTQKEKNR